MTAKTISINFYGLPLIVEGDFYPEEKPYFNAREGVGHPGESASFIINKVSLENDPTADPESIIVAGKLWETLERDCIEKINAG